MSKSNVELCCVPVRRDNLLQYLCSLDLEIAMLSYLITIYLTKGLLEDQLKPISQTLVYRNLVAY